MQLTTDIKCIKVVRFSTFLSNGTLKEQIKLSQHIKQNF